jgi:hypothetical protein
MGVFILLLVAIVIVGKIALKIMERQQKPSHVNEVNPVREDQDAAVVYFNHCAKKFLKKKYPSMITFKITYGKYTGGARTSQLGFAVKLEDGSWEHCLVDTNSIFWNTNILEEEAEEFVKGVEDAFYKEHLQNILVKIEIAKLAKDYSCEYDISELEDDQLDKLLTLLSDEGIQYVKEGKMLQIVVHLDENVA